MQQTTYGGTDWRDLPRGILPTARQMAFLAWLRQEHRAWFDELQMLVELVPSEGAGPTHRWPADEAHPAYQVFLRRWEALWTVWAAAGQPDPAHHMDPTQRELCIRSHQIALDAGRATTPHH